VFYGRRRDKSCQLSFVRFSLRRFISAPVSGLAKNVYFDDGQTVSIIPGRLLLSEKNRSILKHHHEQIGGISLTYYLLRTDHTV
jgi:hypothetical protein